MWIYRYLYHTASLTCSPAQESLGEVPTDDVGPRPLCCAGWLGLKEAQAEPGPHRAWLGTANSVGKSRSCASPRNKKGAPGEERERRGI